MLFRSLALTGEAIDADTAERWGMIWKVVEDENLLAEARGYAAHLATQPTKALGTAKQMLQQSFGNSLETQLDLERDMQNELGQSEDFREGVSAFFEKRTPVFKGR